jgi:flavin-dependent dehydrogenase
MVFDVLVLGAGPAGCAAAIRAAQAGLHVALLEKSAFPRDLPGEALHPDVDDLFGELGVGEAISTAGFITYPGWILERRILNRSNDRTFIPFAGPSGLRFGRQAWRSELDSILLERARSSGVTVSLSANCANPILEADRVSGLEVNGERWLSRYVVDASGATGWLARKLRLRTQEFSDKLVARYAYFEDRALGMIPEFHEDACGWTWLARVKKHVCQCVQLSLTKAPLPLPDCVPSDTRFRGANVTWRMVPECAGAGYFLCGDAAAVLDPAASSGMARALASGLKAADLMIRIAKDRMDGQMAAAVYRRWYANLFIEQARALAARYGELDAPPAWLGGLEARFGEIERLPLNSLANPADAVITSS